jgi:hypothetical protein
VAASIDAQLVLYPGSFVDLAASSAFRSVTYVDSDARAARFFADRDEVDAIVAEFGIEGATWTFRHADYRTELGLADESFDLLVSLYAGFVSEGCARYVRPGGWLLVNSSHGDVALTALSAQWELVGVVLIRGGGYRVRLSGLDGFLIPKRGAEPTREEIMESGRGIAYTRPAAAYLFQKSARGDRELR